MKLQDKLIQYFDAGYPIIFINSYEEIKTDEIIRNAAGGRTIQEWNDASLYCDFESKNTHADGEMTLEETLDFLKNEDNLEKQMLVLKDAVSYFEDKRVVSLLKELALKIECGLDACIVIVSSVVTIPKELENYITILETDPLDEDEIRAIVKDFCNRDDIKMTVSENLIEKMSIAFKGLTEFEIENLLASAIAKDGELTSDSLKLIFEQKKQMIMKSGILEMVDVEEKIEDIGGLDYLKNWLDIKAKIYKNINKAIKFGVDMPKGVLVAGLPGCGKSLTAKVTSSMFEVPLMKLDIGRILGKYVRESEENMRKAIKLAENISPCILWIDELEKAFAGINGNGNEVTQRLFGSFLTWLQEKKSPVFVVATANNITTLPAEFLRQGRFDEIFYCDFPSPAEREKIFEIHIKKRRPDDLKHIDLKSLAEKTNDFSGADIEGVVREAVENAFVNNRSSLSFVDIIEKIECAKPLSELMPDYINTIKDYYEKNSFVNATTGGTNGKQNY